MPNGLPVMVKALGLHFGDLERRLYGLGFRVLGSKVWGLGFREPSYETQNCSGLPVLDPSEPWATTSRNPRMLRPDPCQRASGPCRKVSKRFGAQKDFATSPDATEFERCLISFGLLTRVHSYSTRRWPL